MDQRTINLGHRVAAIRAERNRLTKVVADSEVARDDAAAAEALLEKVEILYRTVMEKSLSASFAVVEDLVSEGLATVYGSKRLQFKLDPVHKRGTFSVQPSTHDVISDVDGPTEDTFGGAVVQIEAFLLRVVFLLQMKAVPFMVMDESFNCVSAGYLQNLAQLLRDLCRRFKIDMLLVTHQQEMTEAADKVFHLVDRQDGKGATLK